MRIVYATDLHGAWNLVGPLLERTTADVYIIAGDLLKNHFRRSADFFRFNGLEDYFRLLRCTRGVERLGRSFVETRLGSPDASEEERRKAKEYLRLHRIARETILEDLGRLESIFSEHPEKRIFVLPGNYDIDLKETPLRLRDLHKAVISVKGLRFAGYGGAAVQTPGLPEDLRIPYGETRTGGTLHSEPRDFLTRANADIVVLHLPPFGYFDMLRSYGHVGSVGVRDYLETTPPKILLCGHFHEHWGVLRHGATILANPSNFGQVLDTAGVKRGGYFFDFILDGPSFVVGTIRVLEHRAIYDIADYRLDEAGPLRQVVIDGPRMSVLSREKKAQQESTLRQIRDFNLVKRFFRQYETPATRRRIEDLRKVYRELRGHGHHVAFDVMGSVNFGMSDPDSDVDLVIYRRCPCTHALAETSCVLPAGLSRCFKDLEKDYQVEVTDCVNINHVEEAIRNEDPYNPALQRFVLYRSICRPINLRMIREIEALLSEKRGLKERVEYLLKDYFKEIVISNSHIYSFKKYEVRLHEQGVQLPVRVRQKLDAYLGIRRDQR